MCVPLYLMCISCRPASVGEYCTVTVPSRLSVISGWADLPEGISTSPERESERRRQMFTVFVYFHLTSLFFIHVLSKLINVLFSVCFECKDKQRLSTTYFKKKVRKDIFDL